MPSAFAIFAQPHDICFFAAGTLTLLRQNGWEIYCMALSSGECASKVFGPQQTIEIRVKEAMTAAQLLDARFHGSPGKDFQLLYEVESVRRVASTLRKVKPAIILTHSPENDLEDHTGTARTVVSAALVRSMPNFGTHPPSESSDFETAIYHCVPQGIRDSMRRRVFSETYVDTGSVHERKRAALQAHASQLTWSIETLGINCLDAVDEMSRELGRMSGKFEHAEGWRRHSHQGLSRREIDPLGEALSRHVSLNPAYGPALDRGTYPSS